MLVITDEQAQTNLAANLQRLLDSRELSQVALAAKTGLSQMAISRYMRGLTCPSLAIAARLAEALDVSIESLLRETESRKAS